MYLLEKHKTMIKNKQHLINIYCLFKVSVTQTMSIDKTGGRQITTKNCLQDTWKGNERI